MRFIIAIIDFLLYSNLWIACAAAAMAVQTQFLLMGSVQPTPLLGFIFFATLLLYALHRIIGLQKAGPFQSHGRYKVIAQFKRHISFYAAVSAVGAVICFLQLTRPLQLATILPALAALGYVLPFWGGRRLRDLNYVKVFLIAIAWAWITVYLPAREFGMGWNIPMYAMVLERAFFVFAITLPFDIRDLEIDRFNGVRTIPARWGLRAAKLLSLACLLAMLALAWLNFHIDVYNPGHFRALALSALITYALVAAAGRVQHDYYYTGVLDGMMVLQFALVWIMR